MHEILGSLSAGARVLDLGCRSGSFATVERLTIVRLDIDQPVQAGGALAVQADATRLPFGDRSFDAVISNHSLEHFVALERTLDEVGRVLKPVGALYAAVPDATTLTGRLYRWMANGGGHVNAFTSAQQVASLVERHAGLALAGSRTLFSSLSFLHRRSQPARTTRKSWLFLNGNETVLRVVAALSRLLDIRFGTRFSVYGWALYFGAIDEPIDPTPWNNVCVGCGSGFFDSWLLARGRASGGLLWQTFSCPSCGSRSPFFSQHRFGDSLH